MSDQSNQPSEKITNASLMSQMLAIAQKAEEQRYHGIFDSLEETQEKMITAAKDSVVVDKTKKTLKDSYGNSLLAIGTQDKVESFTNYGFSNDTLNYPLWLALYNDSWVFRRAIDKPAQDEIRCGITLQGAADKTEVQKQIKKARFDLIKLLQWGALFGGSGAVMMFDNMKDEEYSQPINWNKIKQAKVIRYYVTDRWYGLQQSDATVDDMSDLDFGKPKYYTVTFPDGKQMTCHHDFVLRYEHRTAPPLIKNGQLQGWGYAEGSHILNELSRDDKLKSSIQSLVDKSLIEVIKMAGMRGVFMGQDDASKQQLQQRLEMVNWGRNFNSLTFLDRDDEYSMNHYSGLGGLSDILEKNMWLISAALEMQGVLFGDLKQGFANDAEALERYDETINGRCESYVRPIYEKLLRIFYAMKGIDEPVEFEFNSLLAKQQDEKRMMNIKDFIAICSTLLTDGVITAKQYAESLEKYSSKGVIDFGLTQDAINKLDDRIKEEMEGIDLGDV